MDKDGKQQTFADTTEDSLNLKVYDSSKLKLIRAKLPIKNSLKMAAGSFKKKPFRLAMTVLLSTVAFSLFGLVNTMSSYDKVNTWSDSIIDSNVDYTAFTKQYLIEDGRWSYYTRKKLEVEDIENIKANCPESALTPVVDMNGYHISFWSNIFNESLLAPFESVPFYSTEFSGVATITDDVIDTMGFHLTGKLPVKEHEIVITKRIAESFLVGGYADLEANGEEVKITSVDEMIGRKLHLFADKEQSYTITGILDTNFDESRYEIFKKENDPSKSGISVFMLQQELDEIMTNSYHNLMYVDETLFQKIYHANIGVSVYGDTYYFSLEDNETHYSMDYILEESEIYESGLGEVLFFDSDQKELNHNEILVTPELLQQNEKLYSLLSKADSAEKLVQILMEHLNEIQLTLQLNQKKNLWEPSNTKLKIAGIYITNYPYSESIVVENGFLEKNSIERDGRYTTVLGKMPKSQEKIKEVVQYSYDNGLEEIKYSLRNCTTYLIDNVNDFVESTRVVFFWIGIGFAVFAGLMLMNFIMTSISYRKREIGILRAVGARGQDVFSIFFLESTMIAIINWVLATAATTAMVHWLNRFIRIRYNFIITIFHFGIIQTILMFLLSISVAFVSSFIPVYHVSKKRPIEVIRKN